MKTRFDLAIAGIFQPVITTIDYSLFGPFLHHDL